MQAHEEQAAALASVCRSTQSGYQNASHQLLPYGGPSAAVHRLLHSASQPASRPTLLPQCMPAHQPTQRSPKGGTTAAVHRLLVVGQLHEAIHQLGLVELCGQRTQLLQHWVGNDSSKVQ